MNYLGILIDRAPENIFEFIYTMDRWREFV